MASYAVEESESYHGTSSYMYVVTSYMYSPSVLTYMYTYRYMCTYYKSAKNVISRRVR